jgi:hypothetical protein
MFIKNHILKKLVAALCCACLLLKPVNTPASSLNDPVIQTLIAMASAVVAHKIVAKIMKVQCAPPYHILPCIEQYLAEASIILLIGKIVQTLTKSRDKSKCKGAECFHGGGTTTTLDPDGDGSTTTSSTTTTLAGGGGPNVSPPPNPSQPPNLNPSPSPNPNLNPDRILDRLGIDIDKDMNHAQDELNKLKGKGIDVDTNKGTATTPRGEVNLSSLGSAAGMSAAGFSSGEIKDTMAAQASADAAAKKAINDAYKALGVGESDVEGGGFSGGGGGGNSSAYSFKPPGYNIGGNTKPQAPPKTTYVKSDGQNGFIGANTEDVFGMIHRQYELQRQNQQFNENPAGTNGGH